MILANTAEQAPAIDPTLLAFLTIFGAAGVTAIAGAVLAFWQSRRDHKRWEREHRYDGFTRVLALADRFALHRAEGADMMAQSEALQAAVAAGDTSVAGELKELGERMRENIESVRPIQAELGDVVSALEILGPNSGSSRSAGIRLSLRAAFSSAPSPRSMAE
ncbi:hypothetical protein [Microbacterium proteolyticum]|uniref:hypothetical protein n=1 Tax=Microbacterium proteolyticum TaxID=1572644 RepID=UPI0035C094C2